MPLVSQRATPTASASFTAREGCLRTRLPVLVWFAGACSLMVICIFDDEGLALTACTLVLTAAPACIGRFTGFQYMRSPLRFCFFYCT